MSISIHIPLLMQQCVGSGVTAGGALLAKTDTESAFSVVAGASGQFPFVGMAVAGLLFH